MKRLTLLASSLAMMLPASVSAATTLTAIPGTDPYSGPVPTYDFSGPAPVSGGEIRTGTSALSTQPFGTEGPHFAVGPDLGTGNGEGFLDLSGFAAIGNVSFIWGSLDFLPTSDTVFNAIDILDRMNNVVATYTASDVAALVGVGTTAQDNPLVNIHFAGASQTDVGGIRFRAPLINAFEIDNVAVAPVPEPEAWALIILGFAAIGYSLRRCKTPKVRVRYV